MKEIFPGVYAKYDEDDVITLVFDGGAVVMGLIAHGNNTTVHIKRINL